MRVKGSTIIIVFMYATWIAYLFFQLYVKLTTAAWLPSEVTYGTAAANAANTATNYMALNGAMGDGLVIGDSPTSTSLTGNVQITSSGVNVRNGSTVYATYGESKVELGKSSSSASIEMCGGTGTIKTTSRSTTYGGTKSGMTLYGSAGTNIGNSSYPTVIDGSSIYIGKYQTMSGQTTRSTTITCGSNSKTTSLTWFWYTFGGIKTMYASIPYSALPTLTESSDCGYYAQLKISLVTGDFCSSSSVANPTMVMGNATNIIHVSGSAYSSWSTNRVIVDISRQVAFGSSQPEYIFLQVIGPWQK